MGDGMQCRSHPYTKNLGGICAFCLQEKLGKLVSSSFPPPKQVLDSSPPSSPPSFRSDTVGATAAKLPFRLAKKSKTTLPETSSPANRAADIVYERSKSTAAAVYGHELSPRRRGGFWSFLHLYSSKHHSRGNSTSSGKKVENFNSTSKADKNEMRTTQTEAGSSSSSSKRKEESVTEAGEGRRVNGVERKMWRSSSVGSGSKSFPGEFSERISNGHGDCALRRVESQREGGSKAKLNNGGVISKPSNGGGGGVGMRDIVRCGGLFGGFMIMTSTSTSSSSSSSSSSADHHHHHHHLVNGRNRSWGWAFASPMRAFTTKASSGKDGKRDRTITESISKKTTSNLNAIPSILI